jgi:hypothetical protein
MQRQDVIKRIATAIYRAENYSADPDPEDAWRQYEAAARAAMEEIIDLLFGVE